MALSVSQVLAYLAPLAPILEPEIMSLEAAGIAELNTLIAGVSSPDLKVLLSALSAAVDSAAKTELGKLVP